jgi:hypothetical protein
MGLFLRFLASVGIDNVVERIQWLFNISNNWIVVKLDPKTSTVKAKSRYGQRADVAFNALETAPIDVQLERV